MSILAIGWVLKQKTGSPLSKLILIKLADNYNENDHRCFPSLQHICDQTEISKKAVIHHLKELEKKGFIGIEKRKTDRNGWLSNFYTLPKFEDPPSIPQALPLYPTDTTLVSHGNSNQKINRKTNLSIFKHHSTNEKDTTKKKHIVGLPIADQFLNWWCVQYLQLTGEVYKVNKPMEPTLIKRLLKDYSMEKVKEVAHKLLYTTDLWLIEKAGRTIGTLSNRWNVLATAGIAVGQQPVEGIYYDEEELRVREEKKKAENNHHG